MGNIIYQIVASCPYGPQLLSADREILMRSFCLNDAGILLFRDDSSASADKCLLPQ